MKINEEVAQTTTITSDTYSSSSSSYDDLSAVDLLGITREEAGAYDYTYNSEHRSHYIGYNDSWMKKLEFIVINYVLFFYLSNYNVIY